LRGVGPTSNYESVNQYSSHIYEAPYFPVIGFKGAEIMRLGTIDQLKIVGFKSKIEKDGRE